MLLIRQTITLLIKTFTIAAVREGTTLVFRSVVIPLVLVLFLAVVRRLSNPPQNFGIGNLSPIRPLSSAFSDVSGTRPSFVLVNNGFSGGAIENVIKSIAGVAQAAGMNVQIAAQESDLFTLCRSSLAGVSACFGAVVFHSSPTQPSAGGYWNYTLRADAALGNTIHTNANDNDVQVYLLPLQHAIDSAITGTLPNVVDEFPYTSLTQRQYTDRLRVNFMNSIIDVLGAAFFAGMVGVIYHIIGFMVSERESGMTQLVDSMMPNKRQWEKQLARLMSHHIAFSFMYAPGWVMVAILLAIGVFSKTSVAIVLIYHLLAGVALSSFALFGAAFFDRAQLSGNSITIASILMAILAQYAGKSGLAPVIILAILFPPSNYVFFLTYMARWEKEDLGTNLLKHAPSSPWALSGIILWVILVIQAVLFPVLAALVERYFFGTMSHQREIAPTSDETEIVKISNFSHTYKPSIFDKLVTRIFWRTSEDVLAVDNVNLSVRDGQITVLLGANGSGKSSLPNAITGVNKVTSGHIGINGNGALGYAPQKNILWDNLTVREHIQIFDGLKATGRRAPRREITSLIQKCDLEQKRNERAKTLSGGQKRKLQLALMFAGGSKICCVDEVTSGLDPLSRRKVWDILLAERGQRAVIFTTHFLDEAGLLADKIAILSKGSICASGSTVELTSALGGDYSIVMDKKYNHVDMGDNGEFKRIESSKNVTIFVPNSTTAALLARNLEKKGIVDYQVNGPTIEDVFLKLADRDRNLTATPPRSLETENIGEAQIKTAGSVVTQVESGSNRLVLYSATPIGLVSQVWVLIQKRMTVLKRNWFPHLFAFVVPIIAAGLTTLLIKNYSATSCSLVDLVRPSPIRSWAKQENVTLVVGPSSSFDESKIALLTYIASGGASATSHAPPKVKFETVNTLDEFDKYINANFSAVTPGGFFLGDRPRVAYKGDSGISSGLLTQNTLNSLLANTSIATQFSNFDIPVAPNTAGSLQLVLYFCFAIGISTAFFALYPTLERLQGIRELQYSNGVRAMPLWLSHLAFDWAFMAVVSAITVIIFAAVRNIWYHIGYLFLVLILFSMASILLSYHVSNISTSQLAAFAIMGAIQGTMVLVYIIATVLVRSFISTTKVDSDILTINYALSAFFPIGNLVRGFFVALNILSTSCSGSFLSSNPASMPQYGGPILFLILQNIILFIWLVGIDMYSPAAFRLGKKQPSTEAGMETAAVLPNEVANMGGENNSIHVSDPLRVFSLRKTFRKKVAVDSVSFSVKESETFALLGPNGAGKSTTISLIRGELCPDSQNGGDVFIAGRSILSDRTGTRMKLGVCPQFDALDNMTVLEHLVFYSRVRGVPNYNHNVAAILDAIGLSELAHRGVRTLSGGNKRKLSLGIALSGDPELLVLDEPSSGLDPLSKRAMWQTLRSVVTGRSLLLTTHSMEEADAIADRVGILAQRMLVIGDIPSLMQAEGMQYHVSILLRSAPTTLADEMEWLKQWVAGNIPGAELEQKSFHGQMRFMVPMPQSDATRPIHSKPRHSIAGLLQVLERNKEALGFASYTVTQMTMDQLFLHVVSRQNVQEEGTNDREEIIKTCLCGLHW